MRLWQLITFAALAIFGFTLASKGKKVADQKQKLLPAKPENMPRVLELLKESVSIANDLFERWRLRNYECEHFDAVVAEWIGVHDKRNKEIHQEHLKIGIADPKDPEVVRILAPMQRLQRQHLRPCVRDPQGRLGLIRLAAYLRQYASFSDIARPQASSLVIALAPIELPAEEPRFAYNGIPGVIT